MEVNEPNAKYLSRPKLLLTSAGELPDDWIVQPLGELMRLLNGRAFRPDEWSDTGAPIIRIQNLNNPDADFNFFSGTVDERNIVRPGDLLFAWSGTTGSSFGARVWTGITGVLNQHIFKVIPDLERLSPAYAYRLLLKSQHAIEREAHGFKASFVHVRKSDLVSVSVGYPPALREQDMISEALDDADALIDSLEQLLTKKRQIKQGAMQELLTGKRRLPGFAGEWAECSLSMLAEIRSGGTPSTRQPEFWDGDIPWCTPTDITALAGGKYISQTTRALSEKGQKASSAELLPTGAVVMTSRATIGECAIASVPLTTNQGFKNFVPYARTSGEFLYYLIGTQKQALLALCSGSTFLEIGKRQLADFLLRAPVQLEEQMAIAQVLSDMDAEITALEARLTKARALKQAMAQALLTGRIRLLEPTT